MKTKTFLSLRTRFLAAFLGVALVPLAISSFLAISNTRQSLTDSATGALHGAANAAAKDIDGFVQENLTTVRSVTTSHIWQEYLALPPADRPGSETESVLYKDLNAVANRDKAFITSVALMDKTGVDVADTYAGDIGLNKFDRDFFASAVKTGQPFVSTVQISHATGVLSIYFSNIIRDDSGKLIGVLRIRYNAEVLQSILVESVRNANVTSGIADLIDEEHIFLGSSDNPSDILKTVTKLPAEQLTQLQSEGRLPQGSAETMSVDSADLESGLNNAKQQTTFSLKSEGEQAVVATLTSRPWVVVFSQPEQVYLAPVNDETRAAVLTAVIVALVAAAIGYVTALSMSRPIGQLAAAAQQIAAGDYSASVSVSSSDEIGLLARAFNDMSARVQQTLQALQRRAAELATVARVSAEATQATEPAALLQQVVDQTKSAFGLYHAHIYLLNAAGDTLVLTSGAGEVGRQMVAEGRSIPLSREQSLVARAARERRGVIVNDVRADPGFLPHPRLPDTRSELAVPMVVGDQLLGVFDVQSDTAGRFSEEDANIQTTLAAQIATALQNTRQYAMTQQVAANLREVSELQTAILNTATAAVFAMTPEGIITSFNATAEKLLGYEADEVVGRQTPVIFHDPNQLSARAGELSRELKQTVEPGFEALVAKARLNLPSQSEWTFVRRDSVEFPVLLDVAARRDANGAVTGFVAIATDITGRKAAEAAVAKRAAELEVAAKVGAAASTIMEPDRLLQEVVDLTKRSFDLYHAHIYLLNAAGDTLVLTSGAGEVGRQMVAEGRSIPLSREQSLVARAARERRGVIVNDVRADPGFLPHPRLPDTRSELAVPMIVGDQLLGVFDIQHDKPARFNNDDIRIQTTLSTQIAVAIQNARTFSQAQRQAERETALNIISQKIQSATTVDAALQIAARELGRALGAPRTIAQLGVAARNKDGGNGRH